MEVVVLLPPVVTLQVALPVPVQLDSPLMYLTTHCYVPVSDISRDKLVITHFQRMLSELCAIARPSISCECNHGYSG